MDDDSVYVIDSSSSPEDDDGGRDVDYEPAAQSRKPGAKGRNPASKTARAPRPKTPVVIDLVSPAKSPIPTGDLASRAVPKPAQKRKLSLPDYIPLEWPTVAVRGKAKRLKRARTDKPNIISCDGGGPKKRVVQTRKSALSPPKKAKLQPTGVRSGSTPDEAIDVEAEWEARYGWRVEEAVASAVGVQVDVVRKIVDMLNKDCTIPFMARYRREQTGGLQADGLQNIQDTYTGLMQVKKKAQTMLETLRKEKKGDTGMRKLIISARNSVELDHLFAPYKEPERLSLAQRAKNLGLEETALRILRGEATVESIDPGSLVKPGVEGLQSAKEVLLGWKHILADVLSKDRTVLDYLANASQNPGIKLTATKSVSSALRLERQAHADSKPEMNDRKYDNYAKFSRHIRLVQPHQVLAINRGESQKVLSVKMLLPPNLSLGIMQFCESRLRSMGLRTRGKKTAALMQAAVEDAYMRLLEPHLIRTIRSRLTKEAEEESVKVFRNNLRQLLLTPPLRGHAVLGIDPGFKHGCKMAAVSANGRLLEHAVMYPHTGCRAQAARTLKQMVLKHSCDLLALGNGTACRETEAFLSELISRGHFDPLKLKYCIVDESGVSVYSVTKEAEAELPGLDPNIRSAVGIARRLQDPLLEYVKVEPKHLGVGMYQHDVTESLLKSALDGVVVECVSFVGVDINVCPESMLRKVSGLNAATARSIVEWRTTQGPFCSRHQLLSVTRLGHKAFEQCAGFVKVFPETATRQAATATGQGTAATPQKKGEGAKSSGNSFDPLDMTVIHPESYTIAEHFISHVGLTKDGVGKPHFIEKVKQETAKHGVSHFVNLLGGTIATMQLIVDALQHSIEYDIRSEQHQPLFKSGVLSVDEVRKGLELTGRVKNCTSFGAFVDLGVGRSGLIYPSQMKGQQVSLGDRVTVRVVSIDKVRGRIGLRLVSRG